MDIAFIISGFLVGFIVGLTGVGGGSLMTPLLVLVFSVKPIIAVGTDLLYAAVTKSGGIFAHQARKNIDWRIVGLLSLGSIPATLFSVSILKFFQNSGINYDHIITTVLSIALILTALVILCKGRIIALAEKEQFDFIKSAHRRLRTPMTVFSGAVIGVLVTFSSVGAGALGAAILFFLYPRMKAIHIVGTDLAHAVPITAIAGLGHWHMGTVDFYLLFNLVAGSLPGIYLGSRLGAELPERYMRPVLAAMLLLVGGKLALTF